MTILKSDKKHLIRNQIINSKFSILLLFFFTSNVVAQKAVRFQSPGDYIEVPHSSSLSPEEFTIELFLRVLEVGDPDVAGGEQTIIDKRDWDAGGGYNLRLFGDNFPLDITMVSEPHYTTAGKTISSQCWYHIAITQSDTTKIYIDGDLVTAKQNEYISNTYSMLRIGEFIGYPGQYLGLRGDIDEIRIWNFVRSEADIKSTMNKSLTGTEDGLAAYWDFENDSDAAVKDKTANHNDGSLHGNTQYIVSDAPIDFTLPNKPVGLRAIGDENKIEISWKETADTTIISYKLYRGSEPNFIVDNSTLIDSFPATTCSYSDNSVVSGQNYYYRVKAVSDQHESNPSKVAFGRIINIYDDYLTGVYYYPWYGFHKWSGEYTRDYLVPKQPPLLGEYSNRDEEILCQHLDWMEQYGIDFFVSSWWGQDSEEDIVLKDYIMDLLNNRSIKFTIYYELLKDGTSANGEVYVDEAREDILVNDFFYIANNYFDHPNFLHVNGKPVVFLYACRALSGNYVEAFNRIRNELNNIGYDLYLIGDEMHWGNPSLSHISILDGISPYLMYGFSTHQGYPLDVGFYADISRKTLQWEDSCHNVGKDLIPNVHPGFNDRGIRQNTHYASPRQYTNGAEYGSSFEEYIKVMRTFVDPDLRMIMITSWNEWHEDTQIEPTIITTPTNRDISASDTFFTQGYMYEGYGTKYLEISQRLLAPVSQTVSPEAPQLISPEDNAKDLTLPPTLHWAPSFGTTSYEVQLSSDSIFSSLLIDENEIIINSYMPTGLESNSTYYWRVLASNTYGLSDWSVTRNFTTSSAGEVKNIYSEIPKEFSLCQNYPNPFNASTNIPFALPKESYVKLKIYNASGTMINIIVDDILPAGKHVVAFDARDFPSGLYFYKIHASNFAKTKKMLLLK